MSSRADVTVEKYATNVWKVRLSEAYVIVGHAKRFRAALGISSWQSMLRHFSLPKARLEVSIRRIIRGLRRGTFARFAESTSLHVQSGHKALSSSRLALSMIRVCSRDRSWLPGPQKCRSFTCCRRMCPPIRRFQGRHNRKILDR